MIRMFVQCSMSSSNMCRSKSLARVFARWWFHPWLAFPSIPSVPGCDISCLFVSVRYSRRSRESQKVTRCQNRKLLCLWIGSQSLRVRLCSSQCIRFLSFRRCWVLGTRNLSTANTFKLLTCSLEALMLFQVLSNIMG